MVVPAQGNRGSAVSTFMSAGGFSTPEDACSGAPGGWQSGHINSLFSDLQSTFWCHFQPPWQGSPLPSQSHWHGCQGALLPLVVAGLPQLLECPHGPS